MLRASQARVRAASAHPPRRSTRSGEFAYDFAEHDANRLEALADESGHQAHLDRPLDRYGNRRSHPDAGSSAGWPPALGQGPGLLRHSPGVLESAAQQHLDMGVDAAELVARPAGKGIVDRRIHPDEYLLAFVHRLRVERARIDDR
jgi:hypothetical protein